MGAGALVLATGGRMLGLVELFVLAAGCLGLLVAALVSVHVGRVELAASRRIDPPRVHAGADSRVELAVRNRGERRTPVVAVRDSLRGARRRRARFLVAPLAPGEENRASYRLAVERRGRHELGPLELERVDPFGLVSTARTIAPPAELIVYPRVEPVAPLPAGYGNTASGTHLPSAVGASGDDFYGLREYQVGDDLRRVHWPSTARRDDLMIRQLELPWQGRATVVLDVRGAVHTEESIELAVSAAASLLLASWQHGALVRLVTTDGADTGFGQGHAHLEPVLEHLALVEPSDSDDLAARLPRVHRTRQRTALAAVTTNQASPADLSLLAPRPARGEGTALVLVQGARTPPVRVPPALHGVAVATVSPSRPLPTAWAEALATAPVGAHQ